MSNYNYDTFYIPELMLDTPDGQHDLHIIYTAFINRFSEILESVPEESYFYHFAMHCDINRYYYERRHGQFKYKKLKYPSVSDADVTTMKEFILYHAKNKYFTMLAGTMFFEFIAPFMPQYPEIEIVDDDENEDLPENFTIIFNETMRSHSPSEYY